jgi:hypothetical protein
MSALVTELRMMAEGQPFNQRARMLEAAAEIEALGRDYEIARAAHDMAFKQAMENGEKANRLREYAMNATKLLEGILAAKGTSAWEWAADIEAVLAKAPK